jgi:hypothetical protein
MDLNCSYPETGHFQASSKPLAWRTLPTRAVGQWHEDIAPEASVAEAAGEATSFKRRCGSARAGAGARGPATGRRRAPDSRHVAVIVQPPEDPREFGAEPVRCDLDTMTAADVRRR